MAKKDVREGVLMQVRVKDDVAAKVDELAARLRITRQDFLETLIDNALVSQEFLIRFVSSTYVQSAVELIRGWGKDNKKRELSTEKE